MKTYIDRQEILKIADKLTQMDIPTAYRTINELPTEQFVPQQWCNPNKIKPQLHETVLITIEEDSGPEVVYATYIPGAHVNIADKHLWLASEKDWYIIDWDEWTDEVVAWMRLPEPYKKEK